MSAIGHYVESAGIATAGLSLVREHTVQLRPPRALWVPFDLGRPFGVPDDAQFQTRVLRAVLALFERDDGPVILENYPVDAPLQNPAVSMDGMVCPVRLVAPAQQQASALLARVHSEVKQLAPWYDLFVSSRESSTVGVSGLTVTDAASLLDTVLKGGGVKGVEANQQGKRLRYACEDLRNWYLEAAQARPGGAASPGELADWFWGETGAGELILRLHPVCISSVNPSIKHVGVSALVPRAQQHRL